MLYYYELDTNNDQYISFVDLLKEVLKLLEVKKKLVNLVCTNRKNDYIKN